MIWIITPFSTNRLLKRDVGHWQKRSCVMGVLCQLLLTITPDLSVTEGYKKTLKKKKVFFISLVKFVIKSIQLVYMGMHQREEAEVIVQLHLQLQHLEKAVYPLSVNLLRWA